MAEQQSVSLPVRIIAYIIVLVFTQPLMGCGGSNSDSDLPIVALMILMGMVGTAMLAGSSYLFYSAWKNKKK